MSACAAPPSGVARSEGLEPPTIRLEGECSIQLSYERGHSRIREPAWSGNRVALIAALEQTRVACLDGGPTSQDVL
jgi:hypothetical protein